MCIGHEEADKSHGFNLVRNSFKKTIYKVSALFRSTVSSNAARSIRQKAYRTKRAGNANRAAQRRRGPGRAENPIPQGPGGLTSNPHNGLAEK